jgi:hypothetical protein
MLLPQPVGSHRMKGISENASSTHCDEQSYLRLAPMFCPAVCYVGRPMGKKATDIEQPGTQGLLTKGAVGAIKGIGTFVFPMEW